MSADTHTTNVPFFRPSISKDAIAEVTKCLESGWLTTGPMTRRFESEFAEAVSGKNAVAVNSCTAALHLSVRALGLNPGEGVLVPTNTFAATAEVVMYGGGIPILVDCDPVTLGIDWADAQRKLEQAKQGSLPVDVSRVVGLMPVHYGGLMVDMDIAKQFANEHGLWVVEDAAHSFPAAYDSADRGERISCGQNTADVTCFSFYANKTITTGEGGMAVTDNEELAERIRRASLHGLSSDAWRRFESAAKWDYRIIEPGYKYNLTDIASAIGVHQLARAETMRQDREAISTQYFQKLADISALRLPPRSERHLHSWHLYPVRLELSQLTINRDQFCVELGNRGIGFSVHWRPLHLHPLYQGLGWADSCPTSSSAWPELISLPIFSGMRDDEVESVVSALHEIINDHSASVSSA
ncbi:MAG: DegT/DnrJ/EryC1/StrS aminotransferase family protein [Rubripirellula sp.]